MTAEEISGRLRATVAEFIADWDVDAEIGPDTRIAADLEFDSIDVIQFVIAMEKAFNTRNLGFQNLLMQDGRYVDDLTIAEIETFLATRLLAA